LKAPKTNSSEVTPNWEETLYTPARIAKWMKGGMTLQELNAISGPEMMEMAVVGFSMYEQCRFEDAKVVFEGLAQLDPSEAYYRTALGAVYLAQGSLDMAEQQFNRAVQLNPAEIAAYVNRGEVYLRQGKVLEAARDFKRAVELDPLKKDPLCQRAQALASAALETMEAAQRHSTKNGGSIEAPKLAPAARHKSSSTKKE
jgi:tetratricopeptide (TPR) repeat protein